MNKTKRTVLLVLIVLIALAALFSGIGKLVPFESVAENMERLNLSIGFGRLLGILWILGAVGLFSVMMRRLALMGMMLILSGAIAAHLAAGDGVAGAGGAIAMLVVVMVAFSLAGGCARLLGPRKKKMMDEGVSGDAEVVAQVEQSAKVRM